MTGHCWKFNCKGRRPMTTVKRKVVPVQDGRTAVLTYPASRTYPCTANGANQVDGNGSSIAITCWTFTSTTVVSLLEVHIPNQFSDQRQGYALPARRAQ